MNDKTEVQDLTALVEVDGDLPHEVGDVPQGVYEIGYHLLPTLSEEELPAVVTTLVDALKAENAVFVGEHFPSKISLAYPIAKKINTKRNLFDSAYFGWVAFEVSRVAIERVKKVLDMHPAMLRYLMVTTDRGAVQAAMSGATIQLTPVAQTGDIGKPKREAEAGGTLSEAALEEALQNIEKEDAGGEKKE